MSTQHFMQPSADDPVDLDLVCKTVARSCAPDTPLPPLRTVTSFAAGGDVDVEYRPVGAGDGVDSPVFIDGIQRRLLLRWHRHRPIYLACASAGAVEGGGIRIPNSRRSALFVACSEIDAAWLRPQLHPNLDIRAVPDGDADAISAAVTATLREVRAECERQVVEKALEIWPGTIVVDGPAAGYPADRRLAAVVKSHPVAYLQPERHLHRLAGEHLTSPFRIGEGDDRRWAVYLRLHPHTHQHPLHALVRLEAYDQTLLEPLARSCLRLRQQPMSRDARWDRHIHTMAACERYLDANLPVRFQVSGVATG